MTDDELITVLNAHLDRLVCTVDVFGEPFHQVLFARRSKNDADRPVKIILWLDPMPLDYDWRTMSAQ